ncbi:MAG: 5-formyltetrahydrofolate cyclo-ligase [Thiotrichales bacterium]|nr:5-formyltetrahydrofolate cyclo-ligase [Thiotrichales bacterium]
MISRTDTNPIVLRKKLRKKRRCIVGDDRAKKTATLINHVLSHHTYKTVKHIAFYSAFDGEVDITPLLLHSYNKSKHCYLPVLPKFLSQRLRFAHYANKKLVKINQFGISEPEINERTIRFASKLDLILVPLVGFDESGQRLGMGGGYYDRCLQFRSNRISWKKPLLMGIAFECQKVDALMQSSWDIPIDCCITEKKVYQF